MSIPNVVTLYQKIKAGSEGGSEFARIINQLLISEGLESDAFQFTNSSDASGDYKGVDGIMNKGLNKTGLQYKFVPSPFSSSHKHSIKESLKKAINSFPEMEEWILVIPDDPQQSDMIWLENISNEFNMPASIWGHTRIINLMLKHRYIGIQYYPELNYRITRALNEPTQEDINNYFNKFIDEDTDISILFLKAQPTLSDCKAIFTKQYYKEVCDIYYLQYRNLFDEAFDNYDLKSKHTFELKSSTYAEIISKNHNLPGGMHMMLERYNVLNPNTKFYGVSFKETGAELGISFNVWCFINGRWVFFPKPFRVINNIERMRQDKGLNKLIRFIRWFGFSKKLEKEYKNKSILVVNHIVNELFNKN